VAAVLILLPPSEGKTAPRRGAPLDPAALSFPTLDRPRGLLLDALTTLCATEPDEASRVLGLGPTQSDLVARNARLRQAPTARADRVYSGVLYDALDPAGLSPAAKRRASGRMAVVSALFGLLRPGDRVPAYRLSGDAALPGLGPVAGVWRDHLGEAVQDAVGSGLLVDLRSSTYAAFGHPAPADPGRSATVRVLLERDGRRTVVSHANKATKGRLVRALLEDGARPGTARSLAEAWRDLGFRVEEEGGRRGTRLVVVVNEA
jgi:cytoplasmic iron level regulating protein YaaA (DUF328/UPF0246 family)